MPEGGIRPAREGEGFRRSDEDGDTVEVRTHTHSYTCTPVHTHKCTTLEYTEPRTTQTAGLPPRTFGKINRIQEKPHGAPGESKRSLILLPHLSASLVLSFPPSVPPSRPPSSVPLTCSRLRARARAVSVFARAQREGESRVYTGDRQR